MFSQWGLVGTGNREQGTSQSSEARRPAGPPEAKLTPQKKIGGGESLREQGTGNREQGTCRVPQVFPEHVPEPLLENPSLGFWAGAEIFFPFLIPFDSVFILQAPPNLHPFVLEGLVCTKIFFTLLLGVAYSFDVFLFYHWKRCEKGDHLRH